MASAVHSQNTIQPEENFAELLEESIAEQSSFEGQVIKGKVIAIDRDYAIVDVGLKSEGRIPLKEFAEYGKEPSVAVDDEVDVYVERMEGRDGGIVLSREKARREFAWNELEVAHKKGDHVDGVIFSRVKGGFAVDLNGAVAFLPGSQLDIRPIKDVAPLIGKSQPFVILKMDRLRNNIVVSRRAILEETRQENRSELLEKLQEGTVHKGIVKNITDYGAFVDLGGVDGLLHITDISWRRINHPSEVIQVGQTVDVQVIKFDQSSQRVSLGMKQLEKDPWEGIEERFPIGHKITGRITNVTDYGAFVEIEPGIEGLIHVTEMSWVKKNVHPSKIVSVSQEVEVMVMDIDRDKRRISLGLKQCAENPWQSFAEKYPVGSELEGPVKNITEFGVFIELPGSIDGMVHNSDISWGDDSEEQAKAFTKGQMVKTKVLDVDAEKERIALGIKQLTEDPVGSELAKLKKGDVVTCTIKSIQDKGIEVHVGKSIVGFIKKVDLSRDRSEQRTDRFAVNEKVDAKIISVDKGSQKVSLSIKALEIEEEKAAMAQYGSADSGASLGEILGAVMADKDKDKNKDKDKS